MAAIVHGSSEVTEDVDVCARFTASNIEKILAGIGDLNPRWRMNPAHPPLDRDPAKLASYKNLYLITDVGQIDFLGEISGVGDYEAVFRESEMITTAGTECRVITLDGLIRSKLALGRAKDLRAIKQLEAIRARTS
jgi:hypothetical protein